MSTSQRTQSQQDQDIPPPIVETDQDYYDMIHEHRGLAIILNHFRFDSNKYRNQKRNGTEKDCERLQQTFHELGFTVNRHDDLKRVEITRILNDGNICNILCNVYTRVNTQLLLCAVFTIGGGGVMFSLSQAH